MSETMTLEKASVIVGEHCAADDASWEAWTILRNHLMNEVVGGYFGNMPNEVHLSRPVSVTDEDVLRAENARLSAHANIVGRGGDFVVNKTSRNLVAMRAALKANRAGRGVGVDVDVAKAVLRWMLDYVPAGTRAATTMCQELQQAIDLAQGSGGVRCDAIPAHDWQELSCVRSEYEPSLESGWRQCKVCGTRQTFTRKAPQPDAEGA